jgi:sugar lactone lactonase YvrE
MMKTILALSVSVVSAQDVFLAQRVYETSAVAVNLSASVSGPTSSGCGGKPTPASTDTVSNQGKFAVWHKDLDVLLWVDSPAFTQGAWAGSIVYAFRPSDSKTFIVAKYDEDIVGSVMPRKSGGIVMAISKVSGGQFDSAFYSMDVDPHTFQGSNLVKLAALPAGSPGKFNNGNCDPIGRYWAGTYCPNGGSCSVWVLERSSNGYNVRKGISDVAHPNGLLWNMNGTELSFSNTGMNAVFKYPYSLKTGTISEGKRFIQGGGALLDSMCGLEDGSLIIANPGSSQLQRFTPAGEASCIIPVESDFVAACTFHPNGDLYIPTGRNGGSAAGPAGWLFKTSGLGRGIQPTACDV